jgi:uncharacterized protein YjbI with pentapeptide repeats
LDNCLIEDAIFQRANLAKAQMVGVSARGADFLGANLDGADLSNANFAAIGPNGKPANPELAGSMKGTRLFGARGLSAEQLDICRMKGALLSPVEEPSILNPLPASGETWPVETGALGAI